MDLSHGLLELGIRPGDVVAICAFNSDWYLEWLLAIAFVGGIVAPLNYRWVSMSFEEANSAMSKVQPVMLVSDEGCNSWYSILCSEPIASLKWNVVLGSTSSKCKNSFKTLAMETLMKSTKEPLLLNYSWAPEATAIICFTSGTTGRPKGVMISHSALVVQSLAKVAIVGYSENDVYLHTTPLCHIGGLSSAMAMLMVGACHILIPKFEAIIAVDAIEKHNVTSFITVPAIMSDLISLTRDKETWKGKRSVAKLLNGGSSLSEKLIKDVRKCFPRARLLSAYGMTEACSSLTFMCLHDPFQCNFGQTQQTLVNTKSSNQSKGVCVGKPAPHVELKICSDGSSRIGRILTRGPHLMLRYWDQNPENSSDTNVAWLDTGDIGCIDDRGNLWLVGRANGRIKSGGENVYPEEVEAILSQHAGILAAVVVGIPDTRLSEMVVACIKLRENWEWSDSSCKPIAERKQVLCSYSLSKYCKAKNLTGFKIPKKFLLWKKPFPLTTTGKIMRDQVRTEVGSHLQSLLSSL